MRKIIQYVRDYVVWIDKRLFLSSVLFTALLVFLNYHFGVNAAIGDLDFLPAFLCWTGVFVLAFSFAYLAGNKCRQHFRDQRFVLLLFFACMLFAWKTCFPVNLPLSDQFVVNEYWNAVVYWPLKLVFVTVALYVVWRLTKDPEPFYGTGRKNLTLTPYVIMLLGMVPLIAVAATRPDFLSAYPRYENVELLQDHSDGFKIFLFELSYGSDFFTIELFFRGLLVLAFSKWAGKGAILPMAMFYCTIHFGKPLGECISSYFGGLLLGIVTYNTRSIWGGLMVHLGIAWLMELAGWLSTA